jgi:hypothetical protein
MTKPPVKPMGPMKNEKGNEATKPTDEGATTQTTEQPKPIVSGIETLSDADLNSALKLLRTELRRRENDREALRPQVGSKVRILRGRPKYVGKVGTAVIVRKSRVFVTVPEIKSPAYVLISDLELVER